MLFLAQSDTTVGFLSQTKGEINCAKQRNGKKILLEVENFQILKQFTRIPQTHKNFIRRSCKSTFIYPNQLALRVVKDKFHSEFLRYFGWMYSSSANPTGGKFCLDYAKEKAEVIVEDVRGLYESAPSKIYKLSSSHIKRIR